MWVFIVDGGDAVGIADVAVVEILSSVLTAVLVRRGAAAMLLFRWTILTRTCGTHKSLPGTEYMFRFFF